MTFNKDFSIIELLSKLPMAQKKWKTFDHWEADRCAIGITSSANPDKLVYISTFDKAPGTYDFECELLPPGNDPTEHRVVRFGEDVDLATLENAITNWL